MPFSQPYLFRMVRNSNYLKSTSVPLLNHPCIVCCRPTSMWCSRCQKAWYCSEEHLKQDWLRHRKECTPPGANSYGYNPPPDMIVTPPPMEDKLLYVSAILFAPDEDRPRVISISCRPVQKTTQGICPIPLIQNYFLDRLCEPIVLTQGLNAETLRFPLHLWYSPTALQKGSPVNRAIYNITSGAAMKAWCGPVVVLKFNGSRRQSYTDAGPNDLPALSAYFLAYK